MPQWPTPQAKVDVQEVSVATGEGTGETGGGEGVQEVQEVIRALPTKALLQTALVIQWIIIRLLASKEQVTAKIEVVAQVTTTTITVHQTAHECIAVRVALELLRQ